MSLASLNRVMREFIPTPAITSVCVDICRKRTAFVDIRDFTASVIGTSAPDISGIEFRVFLAVFIVDKARLLELLSNKFAFLRTDVLLLSVLFVFESQQFFVSNFNSSIFSFIKFFEVKFVRIVLSLLFLVRLYFTYISAHYSQGIILPCIYTYDPKAPLGFSLVVYSFIHLSLTKNPTDTIEA